MLVGVTVLFAGYALAYFGWESIRGPGVGFLDLVVPGRFKGHSAAGPAASLPSSATAPGGPLDLSPAGPLPGLGNPLSPSGSLPGGGNPLSPSGIA